MRFEPAGIPALARGEALLAGAEALAVVRAMVAVSVPVEGWLEACAVPLTLPIGATAPVPFRDFDPVRS